MDNIEDKNNIQKFTDFSNQKGAFSKKQTFYLVDHQKDENSNVVSNYSNLLEKSSKEQSRTNESQDSVKRRIVIQKNILKQKYNEDLLIIKQPSQKEQGTNTLSDMNDEVFHKSQVKVNIAKIKNSNLSNDYSVVDNFLSPIIINRKFEDESSASNNTQIRIKNLQNSQKQQDKNDEIIKSILIYENSPNQKRQLKFQSFQFEPQVILNSSNQNLVFQQQKMNKKQKNLNIQNDQLQLTKQEQMLRNTKKQKFILQVDHQNSKILSHSTNKKEHINLLSNTNLQNIILPINLSKSQKKDTSQNSLKSHEKIEEDLLISYREIEQQGSKNNLVVTGQQQNINMRVSYPFESKRTIPEQRYKTMNDQHMNMQNTQKINNRFQPSFPPKRRVVYVSQQEKQDLDYINNQFTDQSLSSLDSLQEFKPDNTQSINNFIESYINKKSIFTNNQSFNIEQSQIKPNQNMNLTLNSYSNKPFNQRKNRFTDRDTSFDQDQINQNIIQNYKNKRLQQFIKMQDVQKRKSKFLQYQLNKDVATAKNQNNIKIVDTLNKIQLLNKYQIDDNDEIQKQNEKILDILNKKYNLVQKLFEQKPNNSVQIQKQKEYCITKKKNNEQGDYIHNNNNLRKSLDFNRKHFLTENYGEENQIYKSQIKQQSFENNQNQYQLPLDLNYPSLYQSQINESFKSSQNYDKINKFNNQKDSLSPQIYARDKLNQSYKDKQNHLFSPINQSDKKKNILQQFKQPNIYMPSLISQYDKFSR